MGLKSQPSPRAWQNSTQGAKILSESYDFAQVKPCIESKVFGIGVEAYTAGSAEFARHSPAPGLGRTPPRGRSAWAPARPGRPIGRPQRWRSWREGSAFSCRRTASAPRPNVVSDKIPALLAFFPEIALHVTRPIRWDSDHVVLFDDETREICREIVRCGPERVHIALDYFDASINRLAAWATGFRNLQKALLSALLQPVETEKALQDGGNFTRLMVLQEELKTAPIVLHVLEILARTRHQEILSVQRRGLKPGGDVPEHRLHVQILRDLDSRSFTRTLWQMCSECVVVFPEGVNVLPWMLCGYYSTSDSIIPLAI